MRRFIFLSSGALVSAILCSQPPLLAQFQDPTKEELLMSADPKAPGAAAAILYREDVTDQLSHSRSFYERVKVLTEKGKEMANVQMPYDPATDKVDIQARTIHPDGTILLLAEKPADIVDLKTKRFQINEMVFTLPNVEVGSILEYRITVHHSGFMDYPTWNIQQSSFVHKAHYAYRSPAISLPGYSSRIGNDARVEKEFKDNIGTYTLDISDIPALPDDDWMPPLNTIKWRVWFFNSRFPPGPVFWENAERNWGVFISEFSKPTSSLKSAASAMIAPSDTETEKAQKIYAAVMKLENTDFTREKSKEERKKEKIKDIHNAQDIWKEQSGTSREIALLYVALCRSVGLVVDPMFVVDRSRALWDPDVLSERQLNDYIAVAKLDGKQVYLDPGEKMCPFGMLQWRHTLTTGFRLYGSTATLAHTPEGGSNSSSVERVADLKIDDTGNVQGTVRVILGGQDALRWRQLAIVSDEQEVKKAFNEWMKMSLPQGVQPDFDHFLGLDRYDSNLLGIVRVSGSLGTTTGRRMFLPGLLFETKAKHAFATHEKRTVPVDVQYAKSQSDDVTYRVPADYKLENGPQVTNLEWADQAKLAIATASDGDAVNVTRTLTSNYTVVETKDYEGLHEFYQKLATADQQQVVLARAPAPNTN